jgi:hypothetical protein
MDPCSICGKESAHKMGRIEPIQYRVVADEIVQGADLLVCLDCSIDLQRWIQSQRDAIRKVSG